MKESRRVTTVVLVEDSRDDAEFTTSVVREAFGEVTVFTARTLAMARELLSNTSPELIVLDLNLPDGTGASLLPLIRERHESAWAVVVTVFDDDEHLFLALQQGADGYLLKDESREDAAALLGDIMAGHPPLSARVARRVLKFVQSTAPEPKPRAPLPTLTPREREVLVLLASGHTACSAAAQLGVSEHTLKTHVKNLYRKLDVSSRAGMVRAAVDDGLT
jgi:DNA-binding NarL/FixJ family response regulator